MILVWMKNGPFKINQTAGVRQTHLLFAPEITMFLQSNQFIYLLCLLFFSDHTGEIAL